jgi:DNA-binding Lrp family transcriptional regulator
VKKIEKIDKKIIGITQGDIPLDRSPFASMAGTIGITENLFINRLKRLKEAGVIRRFGATLRHQEAGYSANAMVAWIVPEERMPEVGKLLASFREVTHCYQRRPQGDWRYNLYTMIHGNSRQQCLSIVKRMSNAVGITAYTVLFSEKEFKKTSMEYF